MATEFLPNSLALCLLVVQEDLSWGAGDGFFLQDELVCAHLFAATGNQVWGICARGCDHQTAGETHTQVSPPRAWLWVILIPWLRPWLSCCGFGVISGHCRPMVCPKQREHLCVPHPPAAPCVDRGILSQSSPSEQTLCCGTPQAGTGRATCTTNTRFCCVTQSQTTRCCREWQVRGFYSRILNAKGDRSRKRGGRRVHFD